MSHHKKYMPGKTNSIESDYKKAIAFFAALILPISSFANGDKQDLDINSIKIDNKIKECVQFKPDSISETDNLLLLKTMVNKTKSPGYCGCMSRLLSYTIIETNNIENQILTRERGYNIFSDISFKDSTSFFSFVVSADKNIKRKGKLSIAINCKAPD